MNKSIYNYLEEQPPKDLKHIVKIAQANIKLLGYKHTLSCLMAKYIFGVLMVECDRLEAFCLKYADEMNELINQAEDILYK